MEKDRTALHLFCFAAEQFLPKLETLEVESIGATTGLSMLPVSGVAAVYGFVPLDDFTGPGAEERLSDLEWVGPRAIFHEKVIEEIARKSPVFPAPFGTIYLSVENLESYLNKHLEVISGFLDFVSDKSEWAVKGYINPEKSREALSKLFQNGDRQLPASPGARYLHERRLRETASQRLDDWLGKMLGEAQEVLRAPAVELRRRNPLPESGLDEPAEMIANWAFLVPAANEQRMESAVAQLNDMFAENGLFFRISGPWPPFSFTPPLENGPES